MVTLTCSKWIELPRSSAARLNGCCMAAILDKPRRVGKGALRRAHHQYLAGNGGHASLCPPYTLKLHFDKFSSSRFNAVFANACIFACRSALPVSSVNTDC